MTLRYGLLLAVLVWTGCRKADETPAGGDAAAGRGFEPPVLTNPDVPVRYPPDLYREHTEGIVVLRLFVDETGALIADSTRVVEGSGVAGLDSAALAAVALMRFAPARRNGVPVGTAFLQPVHFRQPDASGAGGGI